MRAYPAIVGYARITLSGDIPMNKPNMHHLEPITRITVDIVNSGKRPSVSVVAHNPTAYNPNNSVSLPHLSLN